MYIMKNQEQRKGITGCIYLYMTCICTRIIHVCSSQGTYIHTYIHTHAFRRLLKKLKVNTHG